jgi:hypothetical protein
MLPTKFQFIWLMGFRGEVPFEAVLTVYFLYSGALWGSFDCRAPLYKKYTVETASKGTSI